MLMEGTLSIETRKINKTFAQKSQKVTVYI